MNDRRLLWVAAGLALGLAGGIVGRRMLKAPPPAPGLSSPAPEAPAPAPLPPDLPPLDASDAFVRERARPLSTDARWADWLAAENLLARLAASVELVRADRIPKDALAFLAPRAKFKVSRAGGLAIDPACFARYDKAADVVATVDAAGAARLLREVSPLLERACTEYGGGACAYPQAFARAANRLLDAPVPSGPIGLKPSEKGIVYEYADPRLEALSAPQKQLIRMGPRNQQKVQAKLREILGALGMSDVR